MLWWALLNLRMNLITVGKAILRFMSEQKIRDRSSHTVERIKIISSFLLFSGIMILLVSIVLLLVSYSFFVDAEKSVGLGEDPFSIMAAIIVFGIPGCVGLLISLLTIASGLTLKKMKLWALGLSSFTLTLWILSGCLSVVFFFSSGSFVNPFSSGFSLVIFIFALLSALMLIVAIIIGLYLYRMRNYFNQ